MYKNSKINKLQEGLKPILIALIIAIIFRSLAFELYLVPTGSMKPTILEGDLMFISKYKYGYSKHSFPFSPNIFDGRIFKSQPKRGDIIVFKPPFNMKINYIKRLVGMPGDKVQMKHGELYINGQKIKREKIKPYLADNGKFISTYKEVLPNGRAYTISDEIIEPIKLDDTEVFEVPPGHYFFMGDNRDSSADSRVSYPFAPVGYVPEENLIGKAEYIFVSTGGNLTKFWTIITKVRFNRFFKKLA